MANRLAKPLFLILSAAIAHTSVHAAGIPAPEVPVSDTLNEWLPREAVADTGLAEARGADSLARKIASPVPPEADRPSLPPALPSRAPASPSAAGPLLVAVGVVFGVTGLVLINGASHDENRTRTVNSCPAYVIWGDCVNETHEETYTVTETDFGRVLLGMASLGAAGGFLTGGIITISVQNKRRSRSRAESLPLAALDGFSAALTRSF